MDSVDKEQESAVTETLSVGEIKALKEKGDPQWAKHAGRAVASVVFSVATDKLLNRTIDDIEYMREIGPLLADIPVCKAGRDFVRNNPEHANFMEGVSEVVKGNGLDTVDNSQRYGVAD